MRVKLSSGVETNAVNEHINEGSFSINAYIVMLSATQVVMISKLTCNCHVNSRIHSRMKWPAFFESKNFFSNRNLTNLIVENKLCWKLFLAQ